MIKHRYLALFVLFVISFSYSQEDEADLKGENLIHKEIKLTFNDEAIKQNEFLIFKINDDFDFKNLTLFINGKENNDKTFKVYADNTNKNISIDVFSKENTKSGNYTFSAKLSKTSNKLKGVGNIEYKGKNGFQK